MNEVTRRSAPEGALRRLAIGADDAGLPLKVVISRYLLEQGLSFEDVGPASTAAVDYPDVARAVAEGIRDGRYDRGILIVARELAWPSPPTRSGEFEPHRLTMSIRPNGPARATTHRFSRWGRGSSGRSSQR